MSEDDAAKSARLHMFISPSEIAAIEDWRFKHRIQSKSEAVRRLAAIGLAVDEPLEGLFKASKKTQRAVDGAMKIVAVMKGDTEESWEIIARGALVALRSLLETAAQTHDEIELLLRQVLHLRGDGKVEEAAELRREVRAHLEKIKAFDKEVKRQSRKAAK